MVIYIPGTVIEWWRRLLARNQKRRRLFSFHFSDILGAIGWGFAVALVAVLVVIAGVDGLWRHPPAPNRLEKVTAEQATPIRDPITTSMEAFMATRSHAAVAAAQPRRPVHHRHKQVAAARVDQQGLNRLAARIATPTPLPLGGRPPPSGAPTYPMLGYAAFPSGYASAYR